MIKIIYKLESKVGCDSFINSAEMKDLIKLVKEYKIQ